MRKKAVIRQYMQYRAEDIKSLTEQRADLVQQMQDLTSTAEMEKRAFSPEEDQKFDDLDKQVKALDSTIEKLERARDLKLNVTDTKKHEELKQEELEERAFAAYIRGEILEERAGEMTMTDNGAVIPMTIANRIVKKVEDICPIYNMSTRYNVNGTL